MATLHLAPDLVVSDPEVERGTPCFAGTGVPVTTLFSSLAEGMSLDDVLAAHPALPRDAARRALEAASQYLEFYAHRAPDPADRAFDDAVCITCEHRRHILAGPGMLHAAQVADLLGISASEVSQRTGDRRLLALPHPDAKHRLCYPEWQFTSGVLPHLPDVLRLLGKPDPWFCYRFLQESNHLLHGETPLEALMAGDVKAVMTVARIIADNAQ